MPRSPREPFREELGPRPWRRGRSGLPRLEVLRRYDLSSAVASAIVTDAMREDRLAAVGAAIQLELLVGMMGSPRPLAVLGEPSFRDRHFGDSAWVSTEYGKKWAAQKVPSVTRAPSAQVTAPHARN